MNPGVNFRAHPGFEVGSLPADAAEAACAPATVGPAVLSKSLMLAPPDPNVEPGSGAQGEDPGEASRLEARVHIPSSHEPQDLADKGEPGDKEEEQEEPGLGEGAIPEDVVLTSQQLATAAENAKGRVGDARTACKTARQAGAAITAPGANRTLLKKCLGVALTAVAVGLLAASTAGTALIVLAGVKLLICAGDAYYAKQVRDHERAVALGKPDPPPRKPPMGASAVGNLAYALASRWTHAEAAKTFAATAQIVITVGLAAASLGVAGISPADWGATGDAMRELFASGDPLEIAQWANETGEFLLYGSQFASAVSHGHNHKADAEHGANQIELEKNAPIAALPKEKAAGDLEVALRALNKFKIAFEQRKGAGSMFADEQPGMRDPLLEQTVLWRGGFDNLNDDLTNFNEVMSEELVRRRIELHAHDSHAVAAVTYFAKATAYCCAFLAA